MAEEETQWSRVFTESLIAELTHPTIEPVLLPPDYKIKEHIAHFTGNELERMELMIAQGANVKDERIRDALLDKHDHHSHAFGWHDDYEKRLMTTESFRALQGMGIPILEREFELIDTSDSRTSVHASLFDPIPERQRPDLDNWEPSEESLNASPFPTEKKP